MLRAWTGRGGGCRCCVPLGLAIAGMETPPRLGPAGFLAGLKQGSAQGQQGTVWSTICQ